MDYNLSIKNPEEKKYIISYGKSQKVQGFYTGFLLGIITVSSLYVYFFTREGTCQVQGQDL